MSCISKNNHFVPLYTPFLMERQNHTLVIYPMNLISIHNLVSPCRQVTSETISMIYEFFWWFEGISPIGATQQWLPWYSDINCWTLSMLDQYNHSIPIIFNETTLTLRSFRKSHWTEMSVEGREIKRTKLKTYAHIKHTKATKFNNLVEQFKVFIS